MKKFIALLLSASMVFTFASCGNETENKQDKPDDTSKAGDAFDTIKANEQTKAGETVKISDNIEKENVSSSLTEKGMDAASDFAFELLRKNGNDQGNILISPLSVLSALSMTMNGAEGETLNEMEETFKIDRDSLNTFMSAYKDILTSSDEYKLKLANSIWFNNKGFTVNPEFLKKNASYYGADIYTAPFTNETLKDINSWVNEKTDGMIPTILDSIDSKESMMFIINALSFDGLWTEPYYANNVEEGDFYSQDKEKTKAFFLLGDENLYIENSLASGFIKPYKGGKYSFAALLPNEGVNLDELVLSLSGKDVRNMLKNPQKCIVYTKLPKFKVEYETELNDALKAMGMESLFDEDNANLSSLGTTDTNLYVNKVFHKTFISLGEQGTKAGATTAIAIEKAMGMPALEIKEVNLDRPFLYMIFDNETGIPFFVGTLKEPKE